MELIKKQIITLSTRKNLVGMLLKIKKKNI